MTERGTATPPVGMAMADHHLAQALESLLRKTNAPTTVSGVVEQLESKLGVNLFHKIDFIRSQIHQFLLRQSHPQNFMPYYHQQKEHFSIHQNPNFAAHLPPSFAAQHPAEGNEYRPPPPPLLQPQSSQSPPPPPAPASVVNTPAPPPLPVSLLKRGGFRTLWESCLVGVEIWAAFWKRSFNSSPTKWLIIGSAQSDPVHVLSPAHKSSAQMMKPNFGEEGIRL